MIFNGALFSSDFISAVATDGRRELRVNVDFWPKASPTCCSVAEQRGGYFPPVDLNQTDMASAEMELSN